MHCLTAIWEAKAACREFLRLRHPGGRHPLCFLTWEAMRADRLLQPWLGSKLPKLWLTGSMCTNCFPRRGRIWRSHTCTHTLPNSTHGRCYIMPQGKYASGSWYNLTFKVWSCLNSVSLSISISSPYGEEVGSVLFAFIILPYMYSKQFLVPMVQSSILPWNPLHWWSYCCWRGQMACMPHWWSKGVARRRLAFCRSELPCSWTVPKMKPCIVWGAWQGSGEPVQAPIRPCPGRNLGWVSNWYLVHEL